MPSRSAAGSSRRSTSTPLQKHDGAPVNQYAQRVVSTPGKQDGLAWQAPDGTWQGPVGEGVAQAIAEGYTDGTSPYHGLLLQGPEGPGPGRPAGRDGLRREGRA